MYCRVRGIPGVSLTPAPNQGLELTASSVLVPRSRFQPQLTSGVDMPSHVQMASQLFLSSSHVPISERCHWQRRSQSDTTVDHADIRGWATT